MLCMRPAAYAYKDMMNDDSERAITCLFPESSVPHVLYY